MSGGRSEADGGKGAAVTLTPCPPWLIEDGRRLLARAADGRLPHALLLAGSSGIGKQAFAGWLAEALLCRAPTPAGACGDCASCRQVLAEAHPDRLLLGPEGASATVRVDAVRALLEWIPLAARAGGRRVATIARADTMNASAANSLLKTLEEPPGEALLILVADRPATLPATVRSRCQRLVLRVADPAAALGWLEGRVADPAAALARARGRPFDALEALDDARARERALLLAAWSDLFGHRGSVGRIVESLAELPAATCLATFSRLSAIAIRRRAGLGNGADRAEPDEEAAVATAADRLGIAQWFTVYDMIARLHRIDGASFRTRTVLEGILADIRLMIQDRQAGASSHDR